MQCIVSGIESIAEINLLSSGESNGGEWLWSKNKPMPTINMNNWSEWTVFHQTDGQWSGDAFYFFLLFLCWLGTARNVAGPHRVARNDTFNSSDGWPTPEIVTCLYIDHYVIAIN